ncbi:MAG: hypothetical protein WCG92_05370 [Hyphomicrobiales bacterium]
MLYFLVLSKPVQVRDGLFGVLQGTAGGIEFKTFSTMPEARRYHENMVASFNLAIELPLQLIRVDDEDSFPALKKSFEDVYERRMCEQRSFAFPPQAVAALFRRCTGSVSRLLR